MISYVVKARRMMQVRRMLAFKNGAETVQYDFSPWAEVNGAVTNIDWTVKSGQAVIKHWQAT